MWDPVDSQSGQNEDRDHNGEQYMAPTGGPATTPADIILCFTSLPSQWH
jgi:hypothetical protein